MKNKSNQVFLFYFLLLLSITAGAQTLWSGYHFVDDHEIVRLISDFQQIGYFATLSKWISTDFLIRFRPLYFFHRVTQAYFFGTNFTLWSSYLFLWILATCQLNYLTLRKIGWSSLTAFLIPLFVFLGKASPVIWRLGPSEVYGLTFASLAFYLTAKNPHKIFWPILNMVIAALFKESFVLSFPFFVVFRIFYAKPFDGEYYKAIKNNFRFILTCALLTIALLGIIKFIVGTEKIEYAGVSGFTIIKFLETCKSFLQLTYSKFLIAFWLPLLLFLKRENKTSRNEFTRLLFVIFALGILAFPQLVLYTKSGLFERYLIPVIYSAAVLFVLPLELILRKQCSPFESGCKCKKLFIAIGVLFLLLSLPTLVSSEIRSEILAWYSFLKGKPNKPHYNLKLLLTSGVVFLIGLLSLFSTADKLRNHLRKILNSTKFNNWPTLLTLIFLVISLTDQYIISFRFALDFSTKGKAIEVILREVEQTPRNEPIAIVFPPEASEVLFSLRAYSKIVLNYTAFKLHPYFLLDKENSQLDEKLIKDTLNSFKHNLISKNEELASFHTIIVAPEAIDTYKPLLRKMNFSQKTVNHFYLFSRAKNE